MLSEMINYYEFHPRLGSAGQPEAQQFAEIRAAGYEVVISLLPLTSPDALASEPEIVRGLGMDFIHIPVVWTAPTQANLEQFFDALEQNRPRKVFVHCAMNMRVSVFMFLYRVLREGVPQAEARQAVSEIWEPDGTWEEFIQGVLNAHRTTGL